MKLFRRSSRYFSTMREGQRIAFLALNQVDGDKKVVGN